MVRLATLALMGVCAVASTLRQSSDSQDGDATSSTSASVPHYDMVTVVYPNMADPTNTVYASVISVAPTATTFLMCAQGENVPSCQYNWTMTAGPSTAGIYASADGAFMDIRCAINTTADVASCNVTNSGEGLTTMTSTSASLAHLASQGFLSTLTVTSGYEKITAAADGKQSRDGSDDDSAASRLRGAAIVGLAAVAAGPMLL